MNDRVPVTIGGLLMDDTPDPATGVRWKVTGFEGWDSPAVRLDSEERTGTHGTFGSARLYADRVMSISGRCYCPSIEEAFAVRDKLMELPPITGETDLIVHEPLPKKVVVVMGGEPRSSWPLDKPPYRVAWQLRVTAQDPFKRSLVSESLTLAGGASTFTATGTAPAMEMQIEVLSAGTVDLTMNGLRLITDSAPTGTIFTTGDGFTNPRKTVVGPAGENLFGLMLPGYQWPAVIKGSNSVQNASSASLRVTYYPSFS